MVYFCSQSLLLIDGDCFSTFESELILWLALANRMWQKQCYANFGPASRGFGASDLSLGTLSNCHMNKLKLAYWLIRDMYPIHRHCPYQSPEAELSQLTGSCQQIHETFPAKTRRTAQLNPAQIASPHNPVLNKWFLF